MDYKLRTWTNDGVCLLCGNKVGKLSKDHIPPQCCGNNTAFAVRPYAENLKSNSITFKKGVYFSTLCNECNNLLGSNYDNVWGKFVNDITRAIKMPYLFPICGGKVFIDTNPLKLAKSVVGHIIASMNIDGLNNHNIDKLRCFVLNENTLFPENMKLVYWLYPYKNKIISRNLITLYNAQSRKSTTCAVLKMYPIAFMIVWGESQYMGFDDLTPFVKEKTTNKISPIGINPIGLYYDYDFPESNRHCPIILGPKQSGIIAEKI